MDIWVASKVRLLEMITSLLHLTMSFGLHMHTLLLRIYLEVELMGFGVDQ